MKNVNTNMSRAWAPPRIMLKHFHSTLQTKVPLILKFLLFAATNHLHHHHRRSSAMQHNNYSKIHRPTFNEAID